MPIYVYRCMTCAVETEALRSFDDVYETPECSACGDETEKIINQGIRSTVVGVKKGNYGSGDYS